MLQRDDHQILKRLLKLPALPLLVPLPRLLKLPYAFTHLFSVRRLILTEILIPPSRRMDRICPLIEDKLCQPEVLRHHDITRTTAIRQGDVDGIPARIHELHRAVIRPQDTMRVAQERDRHHIHARHILDLLEHRARIRIHIDLLSPQSLDTHVICHHLFSSQCISLRLCECLK